jgi:hypothetical protein
MQQRREVLAKALLVGALELCNAMRDKARSIRRACNAMPSRSSSRGWVTGLDKRAWSQRDFDADGHFEWTLCRRGGRLRAAFECWGKAQRFAQQEVNGSGMDAVLDRLQKLWVGATFARGGGGKLRR